MRIGIVLALGALLLAALLLDAPAYAGGDGPLKDKELPALKLSHALQGPAWTPEDLKGSIVLLDIFQMG